MKIYGVGQLKFPGTSRVVWDFEDGPFDTVNPVLIDEARRRGYSFTPPEPVKPVIVESAIAEAVKHKRGRKPKGTEK